MFAAISNARPPFAFGLRNDANAFAHDAASVRLPTERVPEIPPNAQVQVVSASHRETARKRVRQIFGTDEPGEVQALIHQAGIKDAQDPVPTLRALQAVRVEAAHAHKLDIWAAAKFVELPP